MERASSLPFLHPRTTTCAVFSAIVLGLASGPGAGPASAQTRTQIRIATAEEYAFPTTGLGTMNNLVGMMEDGSVVGSFLHFLPEERVPGIMARGFVWTATEGFTTTRPSQATSHQKSALNTDPYPYSNTAQHGLEFRAVEPGGEILAHASDDRIETPGLLGFANRDPISTSQFMRWKGSGLTEWLPFVNHPSSVAEGMEFELQEIYYDAIFSGGRILGHATRAPSRVYDYVADPPSWKWQTLSGERVPFLLPSGGRRQFYATTTAEWPAGGLAVYAVNAAGHSVGLATRRAPVTSILEWTGMWWDAPESPQLLRELIGREAVPLNVTDAGEVLGVVPSETSPSSEFQLRSGRLFLWLPTAKWGLPEGLNWLTPEGSTGDFVGMNEHGLIYHWVTPPTEPPVLYQWSSGSVQRWDGLFTSSTWSGLSPTGIMNNKGWVVCVGARVDNGNGEYVLSRPLLDLEFTVEPKAVKVCEEFDLIATVTSRSQLNVTASSPVSPPEIAGPPNASILGDPVPTTPQSLPAGGTVTWKWRCRATGIGQARFSVQIAGLSGNPDAPVYRTLKTTSDPITIERGDLIVNMLTDEPAANLSELCGDVDVNKPGLQITLRSALQTANAAAGPDVIQFDLPVESTRSITLGSPLPPVTEECEIQGTTQPGGGWVGLNATSLPASSAALEIRADTEVRGLAFTTSGFANGIAILIDQGRATIQGCRFGIDVFGVRTTSGTGILTSVGGQQIGGPAAGEGNEFLGGNVGVYLGRTQGDPAPQGHVIEGNRFGRIGDGVKQGPSNAVVMANVARSRLGGTAPGARNHFVGTRGAAVVVVGPDSAENDIVGNWFGLSPDGAPVQYLNFNNYGVALVGGAHHNRVGGSSMDAGNIISGSDDAGIAISTGAHDNIVEGNWIGLDSTGTQPADNGAGVWILSGTGNRIGGSSPSQRNVISGNRIHGIRLGREKDITFKTDDPLLNPGVEICGANFIEGNWIGLDPSGTKTVGNGRSLNGGGAGIAVALSATGNVIGGDTVGRRNVISGNAGVGIAIEGSPATATGVFGNRIGTSVDGLSARPNLQGGVRVVGEPVAIIGGVGAGQQNQIAYNRGPGVSLDRLKGSVPGLDVSGNLIHDNLSTHNIALDARRAPNDEGDGDSGPNGRQNWPMLLAAANLDGEGTTVACGLASFARGVSVKIDLFTAAGGGGRTWIGGRTVIAGSEAEDVHLVPTSLQFVGGLIVGLATTADGTSEFSAPVTVVSGVDSDGDGVPDALERAVPVTAPQARGLPSEGDRNGDAVGDETQARVASVQLQGGGPWITVEAGEGRLLRRLAALSVADLAPLGGGQAVDPGGVQFTLAGGLGGPETITLLLPESLTSGAVSLWRMSGDAWRPLTLDGSERVGELLALTSTLPAAPANSTWVIAVGQAQPSPAPPVLSVLTRSDQILDRPATDPPSNLSFDAAPTAPLPHGLVQFLSIALPVDLSQAVLESSTDLSVWESIPSDPAAPAIELAFPLREGPRFFRWR